ncbi:YDG/SRA domain-containing protein [Streptomyces sp. NBC_00525]|uniref:YDG/SRA domain-containing protein n=1 Tax=Streptomyces sp. NBC_00525 TaxID=2903660 RepID=UPI002E81FD7B|nr:YDG/SRA domain-containing protein [Streptomyces sp. NBC_00525]WUC95650.1 HNH endonuclease [Streptomyces sp. NBC_00525]
MSRALPVRGDGPLAEFARALRELRERANGTVNAVVACGASRTAVYAALSGARLPSVQTLDLMVDAWANGAAAERGRWRERRRVAEGAMAERSRLAGAAVPRRTPEEADFADQLRALWGVCGRPATEAVARHCEVSARTLDSYLDGRTLPTPERFDQVLAGLASVIKAGAGGEADESVVCNAPRTETLREALLRARTARKEERARVRELATALPGGQADPTGGVPSSSDGFGHVPGVLPGRRFDDRGTLARAGVHRQLMSGIAGSETLGAESVVLSDERSGDEDHGDVIIYTGEGATGDQQLTRGNAALARSASTRVPVRVVRRTANAPGGLAYRYDGLYTVEDYWSEQSPDGRRVWRFRLVRRAPAEQGVAHLPQRDEAERSGLASSMRSPLSVQRVVRSTAVANLVKQMHDFRCQICGVRLLLKGGRAYAEAVHIRSLARPHNGADAINNVLCLCPNCHVLMDAGMFVINDDLTVVSRADSTVRGVLRETPEHRIDRQALAYHRTLHGLPREE